jgi:hypothetical protein
MKKLIILLLVVCFFSTYVYSQGCVMIRNISGFGQYNLLNNSFSNSEWQVNVTSQYYKSFRNFWGTKEVTPAKQNQLVNHVFYVNADVTRLFNNGWSISLSLPYTYGTRTSSTEHGGLNTPRYTTKAAGIGDIRLIGRKWVLKPSMNQRGNIQLGLGIKFATGDYKYQDYFHKTDSTSVLSYVNPSIQLGDGGTGFTTELNTYYYLNSRRTLSAYGNFYYLISPREQNGVLFTAGGAPPPNPSPTTIHYENTVPDSYSLRAGLNYDLKAWGFSLGVRDEGVPVHDLIGGSDGLRRPGRNISIEPGLIHNWKKVSVYLYVPVFVSHKIDISVPDKKKELITGVPLVAAGGSGDYMIFLGVQFLL